MTAQCNEIELLLTKQLPVFRDYPFLTQAWHNDAADRADVAFIFATVTKLPDQLKRVVLNAAFKIENRKERNLYILQATNKVISLLPEPLKQVMAANDDVINEVAINCADRCRRLALHHNFKGHHSYELNAQDIYAILTEYAQSYQIPPINLSRSGATLIGAIKRMLDKNWWNRKLRRIVNQAYEKAAIGLNIVSKRKQIYVSDLMVEKRTQQKLRNEQMLSSMVVINDIGQQYTLKEISDLNVSNPAIRKAELMVRMRGCEELSKEYGHQGIFITITCPSKYHAAFAKSGQPNPKYEGFTPNESNQYLCSVWSRIRAEWNRQGIKPYGFRVAEPQHDGTPHWHILLFAEKHDVYEIRRVVSHYALQEDGNEKGARENRCDFMLIDAYSGPTGSPIPGHWDH